MSAVPDLATLAITIKQDDIPRATQGLDRLTAAGHRAEVQTGKLGVSSVAATKNMGAWAALQAESAGHVGNHSLAIGRLERALAGIVGHFIGANAAMELLGSGILKFTVGTLETAGVLGGLALLVGLYEKMTEGMRAAKKQMDDMTNSLVAQARAAREATIAGRADLALIAEVNQQTVGKESGIGWRSIVGTILTGKPFIASHDADAQDTRRANAATATEQAYANEAKARQDAAEEAARKAEEAARKAHTAAEKLAHLREQVAEWDGKQEALWKEQLAKIVEWYGQMKNFTATSPFTFDFGTNTMPNVGLNDGLTRSQIRQREAMGIHLTGDSAQGGIAGGVQSALSAFSPANIAANVVSSVLGRALEGFTGMLGDLLGGGKAAAEAFKKAVEQLKQSQDAFHAAATGNSLEAELLAQQSRYQQLQDQINATYFHGAGGLDPTKAAREAALKRAADDEALAEARIRKAHEHDAQYTTEDLAVRNLKALGRTEEGDLLGFRNQQSREMQAAIDANRDATYLSYLATVQNNELIAYQNGLLANALRNAPSGFYTEAYTGGFVSPRTPIGYPTDSGGKGPSVPSGGKKEPLVINLVVDGKTISTVVVDQIDRKAASTGGAGSSRSAALELM